MTVLLDGLLSSKGIERQRTKLKPCSVDTITCNVLITCSHI